MVTCEYNLLFDYVQAIVVRLSVGACHSRVREASAQTSTKQTTTVTVLKVRRQDLLQFGGKFIINVFRL